MKLIIPDNYFPMLNKTKTVEAVQLILDFFGSKLSKSLKLQKIVAPLLMSVKSGVSENYHGVFPAVTFEINDADNENFEIIRSVTKWKRQFLADLNFEAGMGIFAEVEGVRPDEELSNVHSVQVDQWDWELVISENQYNIGFLKSIVEKIYAVIKESEHFVSKKFPEIKPVLPGKITFLHAENLAKEFPQLTPRERESKMAEKYGAIFIVGIGGRLSTGEVHGKRPSDGDNWISVSEEGMRGLNGDLIVWNPVLKQPLELSSMGLRVDKKSFLEQAEILNCLDLMKLPWQQKLLNNEFPLTIGGGIGISRTCMFLLRKAHIGEVQPGVWPVEMINDCKVNNINLL
ncbi:MAG TPA: aspartate--ammonia ligase [Draconibacterium sp.]|nr:aspartate--ammonia ligase [Draconibacterium sp.]